MADSQLQRQPKEITSTTTTFLSLPPELRNYIYKLSGCLDILQGRLCHKTIRGDLAPKYSYCCYYHDNDIFYPCRWCEKAYLWVNRCYLHSKTPKIRAHKDCAGHIGSWGAKYMSEHVRGLAGISQPSLTKVSKQIRAETLPMFYGNEKHMFTFTALRKEETLEDVPRWLRTIGTGNARMLREVMILLPRGLRKERIAKMREGLRWLMRGVGQDIEWRLVETECRSGCYCETCNLPRER